MPRPDRSAFPGFAPVAGMVAALAVVAPARAAERGFVPVLDAAVGGGYFLQGADEVGMATGSVLALPAYRVSEKGTILPIYTFGGFVGFPVDWFASDRSLTALNTFQGEPEDPVAVTEEILVLSRQIHAGSLGYRHAVGERTFLRGAVDGAWALTTESKDESLGRGLYDYRDLGGRIGLSFERDSSPARRAPASVTVRVYRRTYPNFISIASANQARLLEINPAAAEDLAKRETHPKDYLGLEAALRGAEWIGDRLRVDAGYAASLRSYTDRYLRTDQGLLADEKRRDHLHRLDAAAAVQTGSFVCGLAADGMLNVSNQSVYDAAQPVRGFVPRYFQFWQVSVSPSVLWTTPLEAGAGLAPKLQLALEGAYRAFPYRYAQDEHGAFTAAKQRDAEFTVQLRGWWPVSRRVSLTLGLAERVARSNQRNERSVRSRYEAFTASAGVAFSY
jgi:hypothetical protein